ncbi:unnamed protein product, partial [Owenia fusiformis]
KKMEKYFVVTSQQKGQILRKYFNCRKWLDKARKITRINETELAIPVTPEGKTELNEINIIEGIDFYLTDDVDEKVSNKCPPSQVRDATIRDLRKALETKNVLWCNDIEEDIPSRWQRHGDLVMLPEKAFQHPVWEESLGLDIWKIVANSMGCKRLAKKCRIASDGFRTPQVKLLLGDDGWVQHVDNHIKYTFDVTKNMFSQGNISEKLRVSSFDCTGETVVDLYAGIGYFTLPYLLHSKADLVHACEWNPNAVDALRKNLVLNHVADRCIVHKGDNREVCPKGVADRVNLGLIPSSEQGWEIACAALKPHSGGILHVHNNVTSFVAFPRDKASNVITQTGSSNEIKLDDIYGVDLHEKPLDYSNWITVIGSNEAPLCDTNGYPLNNSGNNPQIESINKDEKNAHMNLRNIPMQINKSCDGLSQLIKQHNYEVINDQKSDSNNSNEILSKCPTNKNCKSPELTCNVAQIQNTQLSYNNSTLLHQQIETSSHQVPREFVIADKLLKINKHWLEWSINSAYKFKRILEDLHGFWTLPSFIIFVLSSMEG